MKNLMMSVVLTLCACSLCAADASAGKSGVELPCKDAGSRLVAQKHMAQFEEEYAKILTKSRNESLKTMRTKKPDGKNSEEVERQQFEDAKKQTVKMLEKIKALREKAAGAAVPPEGEEEKAKFLARLDQMITVMDRTHKMTWEENRKLRADFEKKIEDMRKNFKQSEQPWRGTKICDALPFSIEYRRAHAFLAEYDKRIRFKSGKCVGISVDTGGAGDFAVYALKDGSIYLIDGMEHLFIRSEYRVDSSLEKIDKRCGEMWIRIPDDSLEVTGWAADSSIFVKTPSGERTVEGGIPLGDSLKDKRYLGRVTPRGELILGGQEPTIKQDVMTWTSSKINEDLPFTYERGESSTHKFSERIGFKSGKKVAIMRNGSERAVWKISDECFLLTTDEGSQWANGYIIDIRNEAVYLFYGERSVRTPDDALDVVGCGSDGDSVHIDVMTPTGKVKVVGHERASGVFRDARYVGMFMRDASLMAAKDDPFVVAVERQKLHPETGSGADGKLMTLLAELRKTNGNKLKDQIGLVSGWHITRGLDGCRASRVYRAGNEFCTASFALAGDAVDWQVKTADHSKNPAEMKEAAAIVAYDELVTLRKKSK